MLELGAYRYSLSNACERSVTGSGARWGGESHLPVRSCTYTVQSIAFEFCIYESAAAIWWALVEQHKFVPQRYLLQLGIVCNQKDRGVILRIDSSKRSLGRQIVAEREKAKGTSSR